MDVRQPARICALVAAAAGLVALSATTAGATTVAKVTAPVSSIRSDALNTCLDVSTTNPGQYFLDTYGHSCNGSENQAFAFQQVSTGPANSFQITSRANGQCMDKYRTAIRQESCAGPIPPSQWTLQRVGTTGYRYQFVVTSTVGLSPQACVQVIPAPGGYPGPIFKIVSCNAGDATQILTLTTAP